MAGRDELHQVDRRQVRGRGLDAVQGAGREAHDAHWGRCVRGSGRGVQAEPLEEHQEAFLDLAGPAGGVLGLDGELHAAARVGDQFEQPLQGQDGGVLPVGALRAGAAGFAVLPGAEIEGGEIRQFQGRHRSASVRRTVDAAVVHTDEMAVRGEPHIAFEGVGAIFDGPSVRGQRVLGGLVGGSAVGDDLDLLLSCESHRVMVPLRGAGPPSGCVGFTRRKGWHRTHRNALWCPDVPWEKLTAYKQQ